MLPEIITRDRVFLSFTVLTKNWKDKKQKIRSTQLVNPIHVKDLSQLFTRGSMLSDWNMHIIGIKRAEKIKTIFHLSFVNFLKLFFIDKMELITRKMNAMPGAEGRKKIPNQKIFLEKYESFIYLYIY